MKTAQKVFPIRTTGPGAAWVDQLLERSIQAARLLARQHRDPDASGAARPLVQLAPEMTGRTGHAVDQRAELYSLGATLYEWATGRPPFEQRDPLRLVHEQLTRAPVAPVALQPALPQVFSDIVMRLLEKEPVRRYHGAEGLIHDLERLRRAHRSGQAASFAPGERDFPERLAAPARPVGREREIQQLRQCVDEAAQGGTRVLLVSGPAGVGKSALVNELRPLIAAHNGRFVEGKFDQYNRNEPLATLQALGALGRLLLTEPDEELAAVRQRILRSLGLQAGLVCAVPEFKLLLGDVPAWAAFDSAQATARIGEVILGLLRAVASPQRPLVMLLDDLHWSRAATLHMFQNVMTARGLEGLVLVGAYRQDELTAGHPLRVALDQWSSQGHPLRHVHLDNLGEPDVARMLSKMLRLGLREASALAHALAPHTGGNPYDTVELVNSLRKEGLLAPRARSWRWDPEALQRHVGRSAVLDLLSVRIGRLSPAVADVLRSIACLPQGLSRELVGVACGRPGSEIEAHVAELAREGFVQIDDEPFSLVRIRHDRVLQTVYGALPARRRAELHLALARRLAPHEAMASMAAGQYLAAAERVFEPAECLAAAALLRADAARAQTIANHATAQRMLAMAMVLIDRAGAAGADDDALRAACEVDHHLALYSLGRLSEADAVYARIEHRQAEAIQVVDSTCVQVASLTMRARLSDAITLGQQFLRRLGFQVPDRLDDAYLRTTFDEIRGWVRRFDVDRESRRMAARDADVVAASKMFHRLCSAVFSTDKVALASWLVRQSQLMWERYGPCAPLTAPLSRTAMVATAMDDRRTAYLAGQQVIAVCEARGWQPDAQCARYVFALAALHWFEPVESALHQSRSAREGLMATGDIAAACATYRASMVATFESAATLDEYEGEVRAGLDIARRISSIHAFTLYECDSQLLKVLRGSADQPAPSSDGVFRETDYFAAAVGTPTVIEHYHLRRAVACALFGDAKALFEHARAARSLIRYKSIYPTAWVHWLCGYAAVLKLAAEPAQSGNAAAYFDEIDATVAWFATVASDCPVNFRHMHLHLRAEAAWARGESLEAAKLFDQCQEDLEGKSRPWHRALITERAGMFQMAQGRARAGRQLLAEACDLYEQWGARAKTAQLRTAWGFPAAAQTPGAAPARSAAADELDTLAVIRASQALGSERNTARLQARVQEVLGSVTGATQVLISLWDEGASDWVLRRQEVAPGEGAVPLQAAPHLLPLSAFRYAERTREPLLLADAVTDDRFSRDPYFRAMEFCSLMVVPVVHQGAARAMLILENRASRGAFSTSRLDAVMMIAGQLAVSLESAQLYERLERKVMEQTRQLREAQSRLVDEARRAGMAQIATNVLHNVGNVLTSVNVSRHVLTTTVRQSRAARVADLAQLLENNVDDLVRFFEKDGKGRLLPAYLRELAHALQGEREELLGELNRLGASVDHIKNVVAMQQSYAGASGVLAAAAMSELVDDALRLQEDSLARHGVRVHKDYASRRQVPLDKTRVMQILVNLIENARQAMEEVASARLLRVCVDEDPSDLCVSVHDSGCGIDADHLTRIFSHGFTTKPGGHGFGLHSCAVAAREMGGSLGVHSEGPGAGATFTLRLPLVQSGEKPRDP